MQATPTLWQALVSQVREQDAGTCRRPLAGVRMLVGGEALSGPLGQAMAEFGASLDNLYGPTETTVWSAAMAVDGAAAAAVPDDASAPIGRPIWNTRVYVLGSGLEAVPAGVAGELYIAGLGCCAGLSGAVWA